MGINVSLKYEFDYALLALGWAEENCPSYVTHYIARHQARCHNESAVLTVIYVFNEEVDATCFLLKWGGVNEKADT